MAMTSAETNELYARSTDGLVFRKATRSYDGPNDCLEWATHDDGAVVLRDSKRPGPVLVLTPTEKAAFADAVRNGEF